MTPAELGTRGTAWQPETRLYSDGVVIGADGGPVVVPPHSALQRIPDTGYLDPESGRLPGAAVPDPDQVAAARTVLAAAPLPGQATEYADMARQALIDIEVLTLRNGAAVAAGSPYWRYVWPRDAGYLAAALTLAGRPAAALDVISYVAACQEPDGTWQARYLPDGSSRVPDDRGTQLDGIGWALWATWVWARATGQTAEPLAGMVAAAVRGALANLDPGTGLPVPSQDYWEMDLAEPTLGSAAPLLLGLRTGRDLLAGLGQPDLADRAARAADRLAAAIADQFGAHGYRRRRSGRGGRDASVAFLLPPFAPADPTVAAAWREAVAATTLPNGGVRPGEEWSDRQTAWTPQVSLYAMTAAATGDPALAHRLLTWLDQRRTRLGALPEKVTAAGAPVAVAPLGMTAASVLIALATLQGRPLPVPGDSRHTDSALEGER